MNGLRTFSKADLFGGNFVNSILRKVLITFKIMCKELNTLFLNSLYSS